MRGQKRKSPDGDPGEERPARDLAPCTTCAVHIGERCDIGPGERVIYGVHVARAIAAGLHVPEDDRAHVRPARASTNGVRKLAPVAAPPQAPPTAYTAWPWEQPACASCGGAGHMAHVPMPTCNACKGLGYRVTRLAPRRAPGLPDRITRDVPPEHRARYGDSVTLTRTRLSTPQTGDTWLFRVTKET